MLFGLGYLGRTKIGKNSALKPGQTFMRAAGTATVNFIAPAYAAMNAAGAAAVSFLSSTGAPTTMNAAGTASVTLLASGGAPPSGPSLDFSKPPNSMYIPNL